MDNTEYGGIRSNTERHNDDCHARKSWIFYQQSYRKFQVSHERSHFGTSIHAKVGAIFRPV
jgi:hypothetical protein